MSNPLNEDFTPLFTSGDPEFDGEIEFTADRPISTIPLIKPFFYAVPGPEWKPGETHTEEELKQMAKAVEATRVEEQYQNFGRDMVTDLTALIQKAYGIEKQITVLMQELTGLRQNFVNGVAALKAQTETPVVEPVDTLLEMELERSFVAHTIDCFSVEDSDAFDGIDVMTLMSIPEGSEYVEIPVADDLLDRPLKEHASRFHNAAYESRDEDSEEETADSSTEPSITLLSNLMNNLDE
jgi:hypothetical protein